MQFVIHNWYLFLALVVVAGMLAAGPLWQLRYRVKNVSPSAAVLLLNRQSGLALDVSEPDEFKQGHIPNSTNIPLSKLSEQLKTLDKHRDKPIIVTCPSGNRSLKGAVLLRKHGFNSVYSLVGGLAAWQRDHLPVEK